MRTRHFLGLVLSFACVQGGSSQESPPVALIQHPRGETWRFQSHLVSQADEPIEAISQWIGSLGATSFEVRDDATRKLLQAGPRARPYLREALLSADPEVGLRSREILSQIPKPPSSLEVRSWLVSTNRSGPPLHLLLNLLESIEDEALRVTIHNWILHQYPITALPKNLASTRAGRLLASFARGAHSQEKPTCPISTDLSEESYLSSFHELVGFASNHEKAEISELVGLIPGLPIDLIWNAENHFIGQYQGNKTIPFVGTGSTEEKSKAVQFWKEELSKKSPESINGVSNASLSKNSSHLWVCEFDGSQGGRVIRLGNDNKPNHLIGRLQGPNDLQLLPGNRMLLAERNSSLITERDFQGNILWQWQAPAAPIQCQRIEGGLTFYATFNEVGTVDPKGKTDWAIPVSEGIRFAKVTPEFEVLVLTSRGNIMKLDPLGRRSKVIANRVGSSGSGYWGHLISKPDGSILACFAGTHLVIEISPEGQVKRQVSVKSPVHIRETSNGGLLVCSFDQKCIVELDSSWNEVKRIPLEGRPFALASN